jgi:hypothetical protein
MKKRYNRHKFSSDKWWIVYQCNKKIRNYNLFKSEKGETSLNYNQLITKDKNKHQKERTMAKNRTDKKYCLYTSSSCIDKPNIFILMSFVDFTCLISYIIHIYKELDIKLMSL